MDQLSLVFLGFLPHPFVPWLREVRGSLGVLLVHVDQEDQQVLAVQEYLEYRWRLGFLAGPSLP